MTPQTSGNKRHIMHTRRQGHQAGRQRWPINIHTLSAQSTTGTLQFGWRRMACALGRAGRRVRKREGDGASPVGAWTVRNVYYRPDRIARPTVRLPLQIITQQHGWCDAPGDRNYNRPIRHPYRASAEHLWRQDGLYDIIVVLGCNDRPVIRGRGSAIFLHCARAGYEPTQGCIAIARPDLAKLLAVLAPHTKLRIK